MENCEYSSIKNKEDLLYENGGRDWKSFFRQLFVSSGLWSIYFAHGLIYGTPTVAIPQIRKEANSTDAVSDEMVSWLSSVFGYAGLPWVVILSILTHHLGRRIPTIIASAVSFASFVIMYSEPSVKNLLICEAMQGLINAFYKTVTLMIVTEYTSPLYRGVFLTMESATFFWGIWTANVIGTFLHWQNIAIFGAVASAYTLTAVFWPESPYWLASRGRFVECESIFRMYRERGHKAEVELRNLLDSNKEKNSVKGKENFGSKIKKFWPKISLAEFYKPVLLSCVAMALYHSSGKLVCSFYILDIIKEVTKNETTAYVGMIVLDGVTVLGMYVGCILAKYFKRRKFLLRTASVSISLLLIISVYLYLVKLNILTENRIVTLLLLAAFSIAVSCGPMILGTTIFGELLPIKSRSLAVIIVMLFSSSYMSTIIKVAPFIFKNYGLHVAFFSYGILSFICTYILYKYLPETKDKTLQEIENHFKRKSCSDRNEKAELYK